MSKRAIRSIEYKIDLPTTAFYLIIWGLFLFIFGFALTNYVVYISTLDQQTKFLGTTATLLFLLQFCKFIGFPQIEYVQKR